MPGLHPYVSNLFGFWSIVKNFATYSRVVIDYKVTYRNGNVNKLGKRSEKPVMNLNTRNIHGLEVTEGKRVCLDIFGGILWVFRMNGYIADL